MIESIKLQDVTIFDEFEWDGFSNVNLVIGENDTGKSNLLKMLYAVTRSLENTTRLEGEAPSGPWKELLARKLKWTFQPPSLELGKIVRKGSDRLCTRCNLSGDTYAQFSFSSSAKSEVREGGFAVGGPFPHALFFPPGEVIAKMGAIAMTREQREVIGFGDTHYDLVKALRQPESYHDRAPEMEWAQKTLDGMFPGKIRQRKDGTFEYRRGSSRFEMSQTADGIKKLGSLLHLLRNGLIQDGVTVFFDEPSTSLHPEWVLTFVEVLFQLAQAGIQIVVATHSYVVLKQFELLAREHEQRTPLCVLSKEGDTVTSRFADLSDRIPRNSIVDASVELFNRDVSLELK
jgi:predicted ATPase